MQERINIQDAERQQFEDKVQELNTSSINKDQKLQESFSRLQDVEHQLDTAKVVLNMPNNLVKAFSDNRTARLRMKKL